MDIVHSALPYGYDVLTFVWLSRNTDIILVLVLSFTVSNKVIGTRYGLNNFFF